MSDKVRKYFAIYQLIYGFLGILYDSYFLIDAISIDLQRVLVMSFLMTHVVLVFVAGYRAWRKQNSWLVMTLVAQAVQILPLDTQNLYLSFRCGISYDFLPATGNFTINLLDLNFAFSWYKSHSSQAGFNVFALVLCFLLFATKARQRESGDRLA